MLRPYSGSRRLPGEYNRLVFVQGRVPVKMISKPSAGILLVEDERIVALDIAGTLSELGYSVVGSVSSGEAAIDQAVQLRPDLVLMDIRLQGEIDGIQAA